MSASMRRALLRLAGSTASHLHHICPVRGNGSGSANPPLQHSSPQRARRALAASVRPASKIGQRARTSPAARRCCHSQGQKKGLSPSIDGLTQLPQQQDKVIAVFRPPAAVLPAGIFPVNVHPACCGCGRMFFTGGMQNTRAVNGGWVEILVG